MNKKRIDELVDFFYSSDDTASVPFRLALIFGMGGADLTAKGLRATLEWLSSGDVNALGARQLLDRLEYENDTR